MILLLIGMFGTISYQFNKIQKLQKENERVSNNFQNVNQQLQIVEDRNGEYHATVNKLNLTVDELKQYNSSLSEEVYNMRVKLKRANNVTQIVQSIQYKTDTVYLSPVNDSIKRFEIKNEWIENTFDINSNTVSNYNLSVHDSLITVSEVVYKGWWIFKKPKGVRLHVKSLNPYSKFEKIESIDLKR